MIGNHTLSLDCEDLSRMSKMLMVMMDCIEWCSETNNANAWNHLKILSITRQEKRIEVKVLTDVITCKSGL